MSKKIKYLLLLSLLMLLALCTKSQARITTTDPSCSSGGTVTITINSQEKVASGAIDVTSNGGLTFVSVSGGQANGALVAFAGTENKTSGLATYTFTAPKVTETKTFTVSFKSQDMADADGNEVASSSANATVTVKGSGATTPKFTDANKTMYASRDMNLRASWSTSSKATEIKKGTELKVTGTSSNEVNGYTWYRVKLDGNTYYAASYLLTSTKPAVETTNDKKEDEDKKDDDNKDLSNNKKLKTLSITGAKLSPEFDANTTEYTLTVGSDVSDLKIETEAEDDKAKVSITGNKNFKVGENTISIKVTAEDKTVRTYKIIVTKESSSKVKLEELLIEDVKLEPEFDSSIYEYTINIENKDIKELNITATPNKEKASVEILGNTNLQLGENLVTILVKSSDGKDVSTYQIKVNISEAKAAVANNSDSGNIKYIIIGVVLAVIVIVAIIILSRHNKDDDFDDEKQSKKREKTIENEEENENILEDLPKLSDEDLPKYLRRENIEQGEILSEEQIERRKKIDELYNGVGKSQDRRGKHF